jgi:hypothetical protein
LIFYFKLLLKILTLVTSQPTAAVVEAVAAAVEEQLVITRDDEANRIPAADHVSLSADVKAASE